jgi:hypothetical protein
VRWKLVVGRKAHFGEIGEHEVPAFWFGVLRLRSWS